MFSHLTLVPITCLLLIAIPYVPFTHSSQIDEMLTVNQLEKGAGGISNRDDVKHRLLSGEPVHFDKDLPEKERTIEAEWIMNALENGAAKIDIENAVITGDLDLRTGESYSTDSKDFEMKFGAEVKKRSKALNVTNVLVVSTGIFIVDCRLDGKLSAAIDKSRNEIVLFQRELRLRCAFQNDVDFGEAILQHKADFSLASFRSSVNFDGTTFQSELVCVESIFEKGADFNKTVFLANTNFAWSSFQGDVNFEMAEFYGQANFEGALFKKNLNLNMASFHHVAIFYGAHFSENTSIDLRKATYTHLLVSWPQVKGHLDGTLDKTKGLLYHLEEITRLEKKNGRTARNVLNEWQKGNLEIYVRLAWLPSGVEFPAGLSGRIHYAPAEELLYFKGIMTKKEWHELLKLSDDAQYREAIRTIFSRSHIGDELKRENFVLWRAVYLRLRKNFEDIGDDGGANDCYYHFRANQPRFRLESMSADYQHGEAYIIARGTWEKTKEWMEYIFFGLTCGYGVKPLRALIVAVVQIVIFAFVFFGFSHIEPLKYEIKEKSEDHDTPHIVRGFGELGILHQLGLCFYFSAATFTALLFGEITPRGWFKVVAIIEGVMGFLTLALFLVTLGNVWLG